MTFPIYGTITLLRVIPTMTYHGEDHIDTWYQQRNTNDVPSSDPLKFYSTWSCILSGVSSGILCRYSGRLSGESSFWHSILHIFWHTFWHPIWHIFQHFIWYIFWRSIWHIFWHSMWHSFSHIFWHSMSMWHSMWHIFWQSIWHIFWQSFWHIFWHSIWPLRSSGAHWARKVPGWGPAVPTGLGRSLVEVQRCPLRSEPRGWDPAVPTQIGSRQLRSSSAHCARKLAKSEELARRKWTWKWRQGWWRRRRRRRTRRRWRRRRRRSRNSSNKI